MAMTDVVERADIMVPRRGRRCLGVKPSCLVLQDQMSEQTVSERKGPYACHDACYDACQFACQSAYQSAHQSARQSVHQSEH